MGTYEDATTRMRRPTRTAAAETRTGSGLASLLDRQGAITGHALKVIRESLNLTQDTLAQHLDLDKNTVQGWESGRRSLTNTKLASLIDLRHRLRALDANPVLLQMLDPAIEADCFLESVLSDDNAHRWPGQHPLATQVIRRPFVELLSWPFTGVAPGPVGDLPVTARRGPTPDRPQVTQSARERFFHHLRTVAEQSRTGRGERSPAAVLLRRQVYYLAAWDSREDTQRWLVDMERAEERHSLPRHHWSPAWASRRSLLVARARKGDSEPLRRFIRDHMDSDELEAANLNYWAYWIEETPDVEHADDFMAGDLGRWGGIKLLQRLHDSLIDADPLLDLTIHSIWALMKRRPWLLAVDRSLTASLYNRVTALTASATLSAAVRKELAQIEYGIGISATPLRPTSACAGEA